MDSSGYSLREEGESGKGSFPLNESFHQMLSNVPNAAVTYSSDQEHQQSRAIKRNSVASGMILFKKCSTQVCPLREQTVLVARDGWKDQWLLNGYGVSLRCDENVPELDNWDGYTVW